MTGIALRTAPPVLTVILPDPIHPVADALLQHKDVLSRPSETMAAALAMAISVTLHMALLPILLK